jgi:hypothetical protein
MIERGTETALRSRRWLLPASALLAGCATVALPSSDATPPTIVLTVSRKKPDQLWHLDQSGSDQSDRAQLSDSISFIAAGSDDEGVKRVAIWSDVTLDCDQGGGLARHLNFSGVESESVDATSPSPGTQVPKDRGSLKTIRFASNNPCGRDALIALSTSFRATAENYYGGAAQTKSLTLRFP